MNVVFFLFIGHHRSPLLPCLLRVCAIVVVIGLILLWNWSSGMEPGKRTLKLIPGLYFIFFCRSFILISHHNGLQIDFLPSGRRRAAPPFTSLASLLSALILFAGRALLIARTYPIACFLRSSIVPAQMRFSAYDRYYVMIWIWRALAAGTDAAGPSILLLLLLFVRQICQW